MEQKNKPKDLGAAWIKTGNYGDYISVSVEIDGAKHSFTMFPNKYKKEGSNQPDYRIPAHKSQSKPTEQVNKYEAQLNNVMAQKAAMEKRTAAMKAIDESQGSFTEEDLPF